ncbi:cellulase family glycosylhydrolase [Flavitalea sp. BT771]|uniref:cellulase family glycosylhydrolase n=1 Tax=Flavitalea sp. BT771 TaxID=3063329 RepID=UPI0026E1601F|nr:cellulase family glycosylhydrolase [Flavitalea sp. BT771]MDO6430302.1 cellulase family glycosylhydrolase [Flavitalea sp. BT771]MDV6219558.1 cellulase family glycosylhydrolase [Flavitalea sp. BT771]
MKTRFHHTLLAMLMAVAFSFGCKKNSDTTPQLNVSASRIDFPDQGADSTVTITCNSPWTIDNRVSTWLKVSQSSGASGTATVKLTSNPNTSGATRSGVVVITADNGQARRITVSQVSTIYPSYNVSPLAPDSAGMTSTATQLANNITVGWNIGNTMEAPGGETGWGAPLITASYVTYMKSLGFNAVRIPCAWDFHVDNKATAHIDPVWLNRVHEVVQYCISNDMYVMLNIHWDGGWLDCKATGARADSVNAKQKAFWEQIATKMRDFDEHLMFASANEPDPSNAAQMKVLLSYHQSFVNAVRSTGGHNTYRVLIVQAPSDLITDFPIDPTPARIAFEEHDYTPSQFTILDADASWGKMVYYWGAGHHSTIEPDRNPTWGEEDYLTTYFDNMKAKFVDKGIPFLMGEYGAYRRTTPKDLVTHNDAVDYWITWNTRQAIAHGMKPFFWETGGMVDRAADTVKDARTVNAIMAGTH